MRGRASRASGSPSSSDARRPPARAGRRRSARSSSCRCPDSPTSATHSPRATANETSCAATTRAAARAVARRAGPRRASSGAVAGSASRARRAAARASRGGVRAPVGAAHEVARSTGLERRQRLARSVGALAGSAARTRSPAAGRRRRPRRPGCRAAGAARAWSGIDATRPRVYGWRGAREHATRPAPPRRRGPAYMTAMRSATLRDDREVVGDVDHGDAELAPQAADLVEDARLRDDVEAGRRLVEHDERAARRRARRAIATRCCWPPESWCGKRRWKSRVAGRRHALEQPRHARSASASAPVRRAGSRAICVADADRRVERRRRVLRHVRHEPAAQPAQLALAAPEELLAGHAHAAAGDARARRRA